MAANPNNEKQTISYSTTNNENNIEIPSRPKPSTDNDPQRTISDITFELNNKEEVEELEALKSPSMSRVESGKCECCGMCEECTEEYIKGMREMFLGRLVCGICAAAVSREMEKNGGKKNEALEKHVNCCVKFNKFGRSYPALYQAEAVKEILKKSSKKKGKHLNVF
ncbi:hypothetical protein TanjilG_12567 [Lupinus angustifolius]|uniref:Uncharacterized protein n=1 Tax=Lupinus angustifolius TaxID=3871 RepID=A0A4P1QYM2_LUPAN|nr:PREDICTED: uncharacterized protein LOC109326410 [Lupinus angustifolius]OIV97810.1 hypothetical protein TanjilG_12567 [Lupinus angustifolius]